MNEKQNRVLSVYRKEKKKRFYNDVNHNWDSKHLVFLLSG
jgi:hypothetical protein